MPAGAARPAASSWCTTPSRPRSTAKELFGRTLVTNQTGPEGLKVRRILVEEAVEIAREFYLSITLDRDTSPLLS